MSGEAIGDLYDFHMRVVAKDLSGYYYVNWDHAVPLIVRASTRAEAFTKAWAVMGKCLRGRGWNWTAQIGRVVAAAVVGGEQP